MGDSQSFHNDQFVTAEDIWHSECMTKGFKSMLLASANALFSSEKACDSFHSRILTPFLLLELGRECYTAIRNGLPGVPYVASEAAIASQMATEIIGPPMKASWCAGRTDGDGETTEFRQGRHKVLNTQK